MTTNADRRVAVITGASSGIGRAAALELARQGWHVIAQGRDPQRSAEAEEEIRSAATGEAKVDMVRGDLSLLSDTARLADEIATLVDRVDVLLNNAGGVRKDFVLTDEGNESTFAGNHLGHFLLTNRLLPLLTKAAARGKPGTVRVVNVSSNAHEYHPGINWDDLQQIQDWNSGVSYCLAKLCNMLFTRELARRLGDEGIVVNAMHPGIVASNFANHADPQMRDYLQSQPSLSPESGADTLIWLATAPEAGRVSGGYFHERKETEPGAVARDDEAAARLWTESEALVSRAGVSLGR